LKRSKSIFKSSEHNPNHRDVAECFCCCGQNLVIFAQSRFQLIHPKVRSTIQRSGTTMKPEQSSVRLIVALQSISQPLVLTLKLDQTTFEQVNALRQQYFPPERNLILAHITLFHALPGDRERVISQSLQTLCAQSARIALSLPALRFLGDGVAIEIDAPALVQLRQTLADQWSEWLTRQDRQGYRPHITIQNKVAAAEAQRVYDALETRWQSFDGYGEGLLLWHYQGGPWQLAHAFPFAVAEAGDR
jgi:2'-5' RNA ligase